MSDRARAIAFYDLVLEPLGLVRSDGDEWTTYAPRDDDGATSDDLWFGFTADASMKPGPTRVAFAAESCERVDDVTTVAMNAGARNIEGPDYDYGPEYYAVFFEDPDGNRLEVCCRGPRARAAS
ncbi:MAG: VOC family protein [Candidatus Eremiobacteraeota bacterium]|nr:VOC family protein [Candidatus Eremiobacteraeota bacterium]